MATSRRRSSTDLGGYTTWPARTAGLEVDAEPKIVEACCSCWRRSPDSRGARCRTRAARTLRRSWSRSPLAYWRLHDLPGRKRPMRLAVTPGGLSGWCRVLPGGSNGNWVLRCGPDQSRGSFRRRTTLAEVQTVGSELHLGGMVLERPAQRHSADDRDLGLTRPD